MHFLDGALFPENQQKLVITAAPYGPMWMPEDCTPAQKLPVTWEEQTQIAVGLPPNRKLGNMGFMVHETDGRFHPAAQGGYGHIHAGEWEEKVENVMAVS